MNSAYGFTHEEKSYHVQHLAEEIAKNLNDLALTDPDKAFSLAMEWYETSAFFVKERKPLCANTAKNS